jgi:hypothetical protein
MQNDFRDDYHLKALVEHSRMLSGLDTDQTEDDKEKRTLQNKGDAAKFWKGIQGVYTVVITNKAFGPNRMKRCLPDEPLMEPLLVNPYELRHTGLLDRHFGDTPHRIVILMLDHLKKRAAEFSSPVEDWAYVLKDAALKSGAKAIPETKEIEDIERVAKRTPGVREFIERIDVNNLPAEVRDRYVRDVRYYNETIVDIEENATEKGIEMGKEQGIEMGKEQGIEMGKEQGIEMGKEQGIEIGDKKGVLRAARVMKQLGISDHTIAEKLGLNQQEIESLKRPVD